MERLVSKKFETQAGFDQANKLLGVTLPMKFGLFMLPSWPEAETNHQPRIFGEMLEQIEYAEELGFDSVWLAEHHFSRFGICPSVIPLATHVAARTKKIRIGTGVSVLTFHNPIFLAEEAAMMDVLSNGRLDFGVGRGQLPYEYGGLNVDYDTRTTRFQEVLDIVLGLWTTPGFSYHGEHYQLDDVTIAPSPVQQPHPPVYLAVSRTAASVDEAISRDLPILTGASGTEEDALAIRYLYYEVCAEAGKTPLVDQMPYFRMVYVAEDAKQAIEDPRDSVNWVSDLNSLRITLTGGSEIYMDLDDWRRTRTQDPPSYESRLETTAYFGTPESCVDRIRSLQQEHNIQYFGANMSFGKLEHSKVMRSMELFAKEVMTHFR